MRTALPLSRPAAAPRRPLLLRAPAPLRVLLLAAGVWLGAQALHNATALVTGRPATATANAQAAR